MSGFSAERLAGILEKFPGPGTFLLGLSGGADSTALLLALCELRPTLDRPLRAVHFHHGLHDQADQWAESCRALCTKLKVPLDVIMLQLPVESGSIEQHARDARYSQVENLLGDGDIYLTAHHREDQAETFLLNLMRGAGLEGLAAIPLQRTLGRGTVLRPLLEFSREDLLDYLSTRGANWVQDPSNEDISFDRNFVRHEVIPLLESRWPGAASRISRTARHARSTTEAIGTWIERQSAGLFINPFCLSATALLEMDPGLQAVLLRYWLRRSELPPLPEARLDELLRQLHHSGGGEVSWRGWLLKRYQEELWLSPATLPTLKFTGWNDQQAKLGRCGLLKVTGAKNGLPNLDELLVRSRQAGDSIKWHTRRPSLRIKALFQQSGIPPWLRDSVPVLCRDDELLAVGDWVLDHRFAVQLAEAGLSFRWDTENPLLQCIRSRARERMVDHTTALR